MKTVRVLRTALLEHLVARRNKAHYDAAEQLVTLCRKINRESHALSNAMYELHHTVRTVVSAVDSVSAVSESADAPQQMSVVPHMEQAVEDYQQLYEQLKLRVSEFSASLNTSSAKYMPHMIDAEDPTRYDAWISMLELAEAEFVNVSEDQAKMYLSPLLPADMGVNLL